MKKAVCAKAVLTLLLLLTAPVPPVEGEDALALASSSSTELNVDLQSRAESRAFYLGVFFASENVPHGWTGHVPSGNAGTTSVAFREAVILRANYFRAMAGVPANLVLSPTYNAKAQQMALMMSANNSLAHSPPPSWAFYTTDGAEAAARSNLHLGGFGPGALADGYMKDPGAGNAHVGHRRWMLLPQLKTAGTGDIPPGEGYSAANVFWVHDLENMWGHRPAPRDDFIAWPPPGKVPHAVVYPRWSLTYPHADFSSATVTMAGPQGHLPIIVEHRSGASGGLPEPTIVWRPASMTDLDLWPRPAEDTAYHVTVSNVLVGGQSRAFSYEVTVFDPAVRGPDFVDATITFGDAPVLVGKAHVYSVTLPSYAPQFQVRRGTLSTYAHVEGAENALHGLLTQTSATYSPINTAVRFSGTAAFHLVHPEFMDQWIELDRTLIPSAASVLTFRSRLQFATSTQVARVQISEDGGRSWVDLYSQAGTGGVGETTFHERQVPLGAYANRSIRLRFAYTIGFGSYYPQTDNHVGWLFDDITVSHAQEMTNVMLHAAQSAGTFTHAADSSASFALQVRPLAWGVPLEWGPLALVTPLRGAGFADWAGSTYADPFADDVGDGVSNLLAYALGAAPGVPATHLLPRLSSTPGGGARISILSSSRDDVTYRVVRTFDLIDWEEIARQSPGGDWQSLAADVAIEAGGTERSVVDTGLSETGAQFYRLEVHLAEP